MITIDPVRGTTMMVSGLNVQYSAGAIILSYLNNDGQTASFTLNSSGTYQIWTDTLDNPQITQTPPSTTDSRSNTDTTNTINLTAQVLGTNLDISV